MKHFRNASIVLMLIASGLFAQEKAITFGIVTSKFHNYKSNQGMSELKNPLGSGLMVGYSLQKNVALSVIGEYMKDEVGNNVKLSDMRATFLAHAFPYQWKNVRPYISGGLVYLRHTLESDLVKDEISSSFQIRQSIGLDFQLSPQMSLNFDMAAYSDGLKYLGHASSFCVRYTL